VERPCPSTTYFEKIGLARRCSEPLPAWPFLAKVSAPGWRQCHFHWHLEKMEKVPSVKGKKNMSRREQATGKPASRLIDKRIRDLAGWRGETLARMRALILEADPEMTEEWKWMGTPVWSHHGIVCTGESYTKVVKLTFARGARIPDPSRLFNSSLEGNTRRAIDIHEGEKVDAGAFKALVKAAVAQNGPPAKKR
jgi:hypothetical protein